MAGAPWRAPLLHTDAALDLLTAGRAPEASVHLNAAGRLLDAAVARVPERRRFAQRWHLMVEGYLRALGAPAWADDVRERVKQRDLGASPVQRMFERGLSAELAGALEGPLSRSQVVSRNRILHPDVTRHLLAAAGHYQNVVKSDPDFLDAWLHLGRVRVVLSQEEAAVEPLKLASRAPERHIAYLALLYRGAISERREQFAEAEALYREANMVFRWGQSGPLALAQLLSRTGREADARGVLLEHLTRTAGRVVDPLWTYLVEPGDHLRPTRDLLRSEVWR